ncbi:hypothetical protein M1P56_30430 [Streptomyces sp. HU2014]|uniref:hypothetical protein n=1 Tax=Streptomyces sp. HU2014 TaxID=2939414 RepID=UPI00200E8374|nr:hypothetical protein [Streptomyces sp. HU2014]UQI48329.1 hypothetical protein M1P56_30430 [Streptomyces sp. HU2014]
MNNETPDEAAINSPAEDGSTAVADAPAPADAVRAVVQANGVLVAAQSLGATSSTRLSVGTYQVCFNVVVTRGTYLATVGLPGNTGTPPTGEITVTGRAGTTNCLFLQTFNSAGALADRSFHVVVVR